MIIWQGLGFLAAVIPFAVLVLTQLGIDAVAGESYYTANDWVKLLAVLIAAPMVGGLGYYLNRQPGKVLIDPETNQKVELKRRHTLFWVPMEYWSIVILALGVLMMFTD